MTDATKATIQMDAAGALKFIQTMLPILEGAGVAVPGPVGLGVSAAAALLVPLIGQIPTGTVVSVAEQANIMHRLGNLLDFSGPQWVPSKSANS
jgi:hypothetical protein